MKKQNHNLPCPGMNFLVRRVMDGESGPDSRENRTRLGILEGWVSTGLSLLLCLIKGWLGLVSGSVSLLADATNNLADTGSSLVVAFGFHWSRKPSDEEHPFGHGRIEAVATLILSIVLLVVGAEVAKSGLNRLLDPKPVSAPSWLLAAVAVTVVIKVWMALFARGLARISKSQVLEADSWNHIFDIAATLLVLAALFGARLGRASLDGWMAIVVAVFIFVTGIKYAREAIDILLGKKPDSEEMEALHRIVEAVEGVLSVHEIMVHHYGDVKMASFHIEVDAALTVIDAHHIAEAAEDAVEHEMEWRALAHVDPVDRSHPFYEELCRFLHDYVDADPEVISVHDVRAAGAAAPYSISFDIVTYKRLRRTRCNALYDRIVKRIAEVLEDRVEHARIGVEAPVDSAPMMRREFDLGAEPEK